MPRLPQLEALADDAVKRFRRDLETVIVRLREHFATLVDELDADPDGKLETTERNAELAAKLEANLSGVLAEAGYDGAIGKLLDDFESIAVASEVAIEDKLGSEHTTASHDSLLAFVHGVVDDLLSLKGEAGKRLREVLLLGVRTNVPRSGEVEALAQAMGATVAQAATLADTSLLAFHRDILVTQSEEAGVDLFVYTGPDDGLTRPFCAAHVGKVYTTGDLDAEDNGQGLAPTSRYLGGFRCRHYLSPISVEEAQGMSAADIGGPEARRIVLRGGTGENEAAFVAENAGRVMGGKVVRRRSA